MSRRSTPVLSTRSPAQSSTRTHSPLAPSQCRLYRTGRISDRYPTRPLRPPTASLHRRQANAVSWLYFSTGRAGIKGELDLLGTRSRRRSTDELFDCRENRIGSLGTRFSGRRCDRDRVRPAGLPEPGNGEFERIVRLPEVDSAAAQRSTNFVSAEGVCQTPHCVRRRHHSREGFNSILRDRFPGHQAVVEDQRLALASLAEECRVNSTLDVQPKA